MGFSAVLFYLVVYTVMNLAGLRHRPVVQPKRGCTRAPGRLCRFGASGAICGGRLSLALISLAGIPLTGGFIGKFYLFSAAIQKGFVGLAIIGVLNSVVSVFYYFRVMIYMYMREPGRSGGT